MHAIVFFLVPSSPPTTRLYAEKDKIKARAREILAEVDESERLWGSAKGTITGAAVGGLLGGPIGLILGMNIGNDMGTNSSPKMAAKLKRLGVDPDFIRQSEELAGELTSARDALRAAEDAAESTKRYAAVLSRDRDAAQDAAKAAVLEGDDAAARAHLEARITLDARVADADKDKAQAADRQASAASNVKFLEARLDEIDDLMSRAIVLARDGAASVAAAPLPEFEDPLEARFRALEAKRDS